jgi:hypothetical protein
MVSFVETRLFTRLGNEYLTDDVADNIPTHILRQIRDEIDD